MGVVSKDPGLLAALRGQIRAIELDGGSSDGIAFGGAPIERALPASGLARAAVHEIAGSDGVVQGFVTGLAGKLAGAQGMVLWVAREADLYAPSLTQFGLDPDRLILARATQRADLLAACEDGLRGAGTNGSGFRVVIADLPALDPIAARRLQLAAMQGGTTGLLIRPQRPGMGEATTVTNGAGSIAVTRWQVTAAQSAPHPLAPENAIGQVRWRVELLRVRGGIPGNWMMEWDDATCDFAVVAEFLDRSALPVGQGEWRRIA